MRLKRLYFEFGSSSFTEYYILKVNITYIKIFLVSPSCHHRSGARAGCLSENYHQGNVDYAWKYLIIANYACNYK